MKNFCMFLKNRKNNETAWEPRLILIFLFIYSFILYNLLYTIKTFNKDNIYYNKIKQK